MQCQSTKDFRPCMVFLLHLDNVTKEFSKMPYKFRMSAVILSGLVSNKTGC